MTLPRHRGFALSWALSRFPKALKLVPPEERHVHGSAWAVPPLSPASRVDRLPRLGL